MQSKAYNAHLSVPPKTEGNDKSYRVNLSATVLADSMKEALEKIQAKYPEALVDGLKHVGTQIIIL